MSITTPVRPPSYIGITGFTTLEQLALFGAPRRGTRPIMAGVLLSATTAQGRATTNRRYPHIRQVADLLDALRCVAWPVIHYNGPAETMRTILAEVVARVSTTAAPGIQLNVRRPRREDVAAVADLVGAAQVIVQVNGASLASRTPEAVAAYIGQYEGLAGHALVDFSGGMGRPMDLPWVVDCLVQVTDRVHQGGITLGIAGGLGPGAAMAPLAELRRALVAADRSDVFSCLSIDTETLVRRPVLDPIVGEKHQDVLDLALAVQYLQDADAVYATPVA
jgi:hypothetical protein